MRERLTGLVDQIYEVVKRQHDPGSPFEIGGSVFENKDGLELKVIITDTMKDVLDSAEKLESFDYSGLEKLYWFMSNICGDVDAPFIISNFISFVQRHLFYALGDWKLGKKPQIDEAGVGQIVRNLLRAQYFVTSEELGVSDPGFLASFHIHVNGAEPSDDDLYVSKSFPVLLFSAEKDYEKNGISVYYLNSGEIEWVEKV